MLTESLQSGCSIRIFVFDLLFFLNFLQRWGFPSRTHGTVWSFTGFENTKHNQGTQGKGAGSHAFTE